MKPPDPDCVAAEFASSADRRKVASHSDAGVYLDALVALLNDFTPQSEAPQSTPAMPIPNQIFYVELQAKNLEQTKTFFSKTFGWTFTDYGPDYSAFGDNEFGGGLVRADKRSRIDEGGVLPVLFTRDLERMRDAVVRHGGTITRDIFSFPGGQRFHFTEPSGNELSVCTLEGV